MDGKVGDRVLVKCWDWQTRVLHWVNALLVIALVLLILGVEGMEALGVAKPVRRPVKELHAYIGHIFAITLILRIAWGFMGNRYARWSDMLPFSRDNRQAVCRNLRWYLSGFKGEPARVVGHDPLASVFYLALFAVLISQAATGVLLSGEDFGTLPGSIFAGWLGEGALETLEEVHEFGMLFIFFFLAAHLTGLIVHELKGKTGLFSSMIHGEKYLTDESSRTGNTDEDTRC